MPQATLPRSAAKPPGAQQAQAAFEALCGRIDACYACGRKACTHLLGGANGPFRARALTVGEAPGQPGLVGGGTQP